MMGIIDLILCLAAIIFATIAAVGRYRKFNILLILSYVCCSLAIALSFYDIMYRINSNDIAGILDIYPTMAMVYLVIFGIVTILNLYSVLKKRDDINYSLLK